MQVALEPRTGRRRMKEFTNNLGWKAFPDRAPSPLSSVSVWKRTPPRWKPLLFLFHSFLRDKEHELSRATAPRPRASPSAASLTSSRIYERLSTRWGYPFISRFFPRAFHSIPDLYRLFVNHRAYSKPGAFGYSTRFRKLRFRIGGHSFVIPWMIAESAHASLAISITDNVPFNLR